MTYFEYKIVPNTILFDDSRGRWTANELNKLGEETWQLVGVVEDQLIFMRQVGR